MSLSRKIAAAIDAAGPAAGPLTVSEGPQSVTLHLTAAGALGVAFDALEFQAANDAPRSLDDLKAWGDRIARRVTYLMEPLAFVEADALGGEVELRSQTPTPRDGRRSYYQVRLRPDGHLRLGRMGYDESTRRRSPSPCQLTREVLERLVDDLVATAG